MSLNDLHLAPGIALQLQVQHQEDERLASRVIGYLTGKSILVTTPKVAGSFMPARVGWPVTVRYFAHNNIYAFSTQICHICTYPFPYLHLSYPADVAIEKVRSALRAPCDLMATVITNLGEADEARLPAHILDISTSGMRLEMMPNALQVGQPIHIEMELQIDEHRYAMAPAGTIRSMNESGKSTPTADAERKIGYGIELDTLSRNNYLAIYSFVHACLAIA